MTKSLLQCLLLILSARLCSAQDQPYRVSIQGDSLQAVESVAVPAQALQVESSVAFTAMATAPQNPVVSMTPGRTVENDTALSPGTRLVAEWTGKWLPVDVLDVKPDGLVRIHWVGWANQFDEDVARTRLRFPADSGTGNGPIRRGSKSKMVPMLPKEYETYDKNGDGQIGMYEWERSKYSEFAKLDKNGDGFLTPQELNAKGNLFGARGRSGDAQPAPANMAAYNGRIGESLQFLVTGHVGGSVWGTGTYTTDSSLSAVAVHAGILKEGEKGVVTVTMVQSPAQFEGSSANGVTSGAWGQYPAAYTVR